MPSLQPYGGPGWVLSCLLPPSAISLFASVLVKHEATQQVGGSWHTLCCGVCHAVRWCPMPPGAS